MLAKLCEVRLSVVAIRVNCAAEHLCRDAILKPPQELYLLWRANHLFRRAKTNHDKLLCENNSLMTRRQNTLHVICVNFQVSLFADNVREFATLNAICEEMFELHIL